MRNLKKLSVVFMMTALFSTSFTSCIDNDPSPAVEAIYEAQGDLLAAQAAVLLAEANLLDAQAASEQAMAQIYAAQAANWDALTEGITIKNAADEAKYAEELRALMADTDQAIALYALELQEAEATLANTLARLVREAEAAGAAAAAEYAWKYWEAMQDANELMLLQTELEGELAEKQLLLTADESTTWPLYLASLEQANMNLEAAIAANTTEIAELEAMLEDPTTPAGKVVELEDLQVALYDANQQIKVEQADLQIQIDQVAAEMFALVGLQGDYNAAVGRVENAETQVAYYMDEIEADNKEIARLEDAIADYPGAIADAEMAVEEAAQAVADAEEALGSPAANWHNMVDGPYYTEDADGDAIAAGGALYDPAMNLQEEYVNAQINYLDAQVVYWDAQAAYNTIRDDFNDLTITYNQAATAYTDALAAWEGSTLPQQLEDAQDDQTDAEAALLVAQNNYAAAQEVYEEFPAGLTWEDGVDTANNPYPFQTDIIGNHADAIPTSYVKVLTWAPAASNPARRVPATWSTTMIAELPVYPAPSPVVAIDYNAGAHGGNEGITEANSLNLNNEYYLEVEEDDIDTPNLYLFNVATNMLGTDTFEDRTFLNANGNFRPLLTPADNQAGYSTSVDLATGEPLGAPDELTANAELWNANRMVAYYEAMIANEEENLEDLELAYLYQKGLFDGGQAAVDAAEATMDAAEDDMDAAQEDEDDAKAAVDYAYAQLGGADLDEADAGDMIYTVDNTTDPHFVYENEDGDDELTLYAVLWNKTVELLDLEVCDVACLTIDLEAAQAKLASDEAMLSEWEIFLAQYESEVEALQDVDDYTTDNPMFAELHVQWFQLLNEWDALEAERLANIAVWNDYQDVINSINVGMTSENWADYVRGMIVDLNAANEAAADAIAAHNIAIAQGNVTVEQIENEIADLEAQIAALDDIIAAAVALANNYKALMEANLAS